MEGWRREGGKLVRLPEMNGFVSPRLGIRFELTLGHLTVFAPDGRPFRSPAEVIAERDETAERSARLAAKLRALGVDPDAA